MRRPLLLALGVLLAAAPGAAQEWRVGAQLGRIAYNGALAAGGEEPAVVLGLSRVGSAQWFGVSAGLPVAGQSLWGAVGASRRLRVSRGGPLGLDLSAHAFAQRTPDSLTQVGAGPPPLPSGEGAIDDWYVRGAGAQAALVLSAGLAFAQLELRGGAAARASAIAGERVTEVLPAADARLLLDLGPVRVGPEAQQWSDRATWLGGAVRFAEGPAFLWGSVGQWTHGGPADVAWSIAGALDVGAGLRLEASYRSPGFDPLYRSETAESGSLGVSLRVGGAPTAAAPVPASYVGGRAVIRVRARDVRGTPSIAGDFTDWRPVPMTRTGDHWEVAIPVGPGVYGYAFVNERGEWFVPDNTPGRRSDGMGGWQAVLVVE